jgi:PAS domain S-box-containing protein
MKNMHDCSIKTGWRSPFLDLAIISFFVVAGCSQTIPDKERPRAIKGVLDLSNWDFAKDGPVKLSGEYEFYWQQHARPENFAGPNPPGPSGFINVPGSWNGHELAGKKLSGEGYSTYRLRVRLREASPLAFKFLNMGTAFTVYVNGKNLFSAGVPGTTPETTVPHYLPAVVDFTPATPQLDIVIHFANFHHRKGGMWESIQLGLTKDVHKARDEALLVDLFLLGSILIMGLYHLGLFAVRKKDGSSLYFGIFCLLIALRLVATVEIFLLYVFPAMSWELLLKLEYLSFYLATPTFAMFLRSLFREEFPRLVLRAIQITGMLFSSLVLLTSAKFFSYTVLPYQIFTVLSCCYGVYWLILCVVHKREGAAIFLAGFAVLFVTVVNDILDYNQLIQTGRIVPFGLFVFIFSQALLLSFRFSKAFLTSDRQRMELAKINLKYEHEIAERARAETALRHSEERYRALYENNPSMYFTVDAAGKVLSVNRFGAEQLGYTVAELVGQPVLNVFHPEDKTEVLQQLQQCLQNPARVFHWEFRKIRKNGTLLWVKEHAHAVRNDRGNTVVLIVCEDITEHKRVELALHESEKLAATGRMAARVAHEINNPLGGIQTAFKLVSGAVPPEHRHHHYVGKIEKEIARIARIVRLMLDLYKPDTELPKEFQADETIQDIITLMKPDLCERKIKIALALEQAREKIALPEDMLRQILYNLILNAAEASPENGVVRIAAEIAANRLHIAVADQGEGIPEEIGARIFEPFFTTKKTSTAGGAGLGLSICKTLVETINGKIEFTSQPGKGTEFRISLPLNGKSQK